MGAILEILGVLALIVLVGAIVWLIVSTRSTASQGVAVSETRTVSDRHKHRWTRWQILEERRVHLYGEVDEGRDLPDRIDVVLRRECARCGLPQTKTVRGLDAERRS